MLDFGEEYRKKLCTPEEAVSVVKSGDWIDYTSSLGKPVLLDRALAARKDELYDVKIRGNLIEGPIEVAECDESQEHFTYHTWHCSSYERKLCDRGLCFYIPMVFHNNAAYYEFFLDVNVVMVSVAPMDKHGFFNFSVNTGVAEPIVEDADIVIVEVNEHLPTVHGGYGECVHVTEVDYIVEGEHEPLLEAHLPVPKEIDRKIASNVIEKIIDGATLQLGIGTIPDAVGALIAESDLKDLGMHTELIYRMGVETAISHLRRCCYNHTKKMNKYNYWHLFEEMKELAYKRMSEIVSKRKCDDPVSEFVEIIKLQSNNLI